MSDIPQPSVSARSEPRFQFGENWQRFLEVLDEERIANAEKSLSDALGEQAISGRTFIDIGCGSGLFSLAAMRLGARQVHSFDFDRQSTACAAELRRRFFPDDPRWTVENGSILDTQYVAGLGKWEIVYSWGVLHHTGNLRAALENASKLVVPGGLLFISIYNDQGRKSKAWRAVKRLYNRSRVARVALSAGFYTYVIGRSAAVDVVRLRNPLTRYGRYKKNRGMSLFHDVRDWLGGYPFEVSKPEEIFDFYRSRGFMLERLATCGGEWGCNEFVFRQTDSAGLRLPGDEAVSTA